MHPALSVIAFTTLSGAGFGLLAFLGLGLPEATGFRAFLLFALAYALAAGGLVSSTLHLGRPERALRAFTQWRSSWLSREAWAAVATLLVMAAYGAGLMFWGVRVAPLGLLGAALALLTVLTTAMIYTQLRTVPCWHQPLTPALFLGYALAGGAIVARGGTAAAALLLLALGLQLLWWRQGDRAFAAAGQTTATATGLGPGRVRQFAPPHTGPNYVVREMVHVVGRRHARRLRGLALLLGFALPLLFLLPGHPAATGAGLVSHLAGVLCSRWLFFAEAQHVVGLFYGAEARGAGAGRG